MAWVVKFLLASAIMVTISQLTNAAATASLAESSPDDPNKCFRREDKLTLSVGEVKNLPDCSILSCIKGRGRLIFQTMSCGLIEIHEGCRRVEDKSKPYPDCCSEEKCD